MKLYTSAGPNPHVVRMFMAEKDIALELVQVDVIAGDNRKPDHLARNPHGQMPTLELDDGSYLSEITAICEYLEDRQPKPALIGTTPEEKAECRMWTRRVDLNICEPLTNGFRYAEGLKLFEPRMVTLPEAAAGLKRIAHNRLTWLDGQLAGRTWLCGDRFTLADILLFCFLDFGKRIGQPLDPAWTHIETWYGRARSRPSAAVT